MVAARLTRAMVLPLALVAGCSFIFTQSPEIRDCSPSRGAPVIDTVIAVLGSGLLVLGLVGAATCGHDGICTGASLAGVANGVIVGGVYWPSAIVGYNRANRCEELQAAPLGPAPIQPSPTQP
jgi:hypothetical protein